MRSSILRTSPSRHRCPCAHRGCRSQWRGRSALTLRARGCPHPTDRCWPPSRAVCASPRPWIRQGTAHLHARVLESAILLPRCPDLSFTGIHCSPAHVGSPEQLASHARSRCLAGSRGARSFQQVSSPRR